MVLESRGILEPLLSMFSRPRKEHICLTFPIVFSMSRRKKTYKVVIKFAARADLRRLEQFLAGRQAEAPQEALQVLDIVLRELPTTR